MLAPLLLGVGVGFVGSIPVGPVNAAVIDTSLRKCFLRACAVGLGGAFVDALYSQVSVSVLAPLFESQPGVASAFFGISGVVLVVFGVVMAMNAAVAPSEAQPRRPVLTRALATAFLSGVIITLANPAALVSWVVFATPFLVDMSRPEALVAGAGIFVGTSIWMVAIAWLAHKGRVKLGPRAAWITRTAGALLVIYGVFLVGRASLVVWAQH
jgi:threonine/homoserine/homoserine lactone efflux protein